MAKNSKKWAIGAAAAGLAGYVAGVLTAPKSGKETRQDIKDAAIKAKTEAEHRLKELHSELDALVVKGKLQANTLQAKAQAEFGKVLDQAIKAKEKARELLSALHEGGSDDKDLDKAIKEVNQALEHLKQYLKNNDKETNSS